ncbi:MAG: hypothetical protein LC803_11330 [Acidobacteria bacterium]|nr:hypothetical protein [Acidobacteriota bacterium]
MLLLSNVAVAQSQSDACHVYVVDVAKARKAFENFRETGNAQADAKAMSVGQTLFPEFRTVIGEEELTTKTYPFPGSNLVITASVFYTDESMPAESMLLGIVVSNKAQANAISAEENAVAEVVYDEHTDIVRAKKYMNVRGRSYLVGVECRCKEESKSK